jgi:choline kinase
MRGIILAAGRGSRMGRTTNRRPKCLTEAIGRPLLEWQIDALAHAGVTQVAVVTGYQSAQLASSNYTTFFNSRWASTNMVQSLATASSWLEETECIVSYGDILYHPDIITQLCRIEGEIAIAYDRLWEDLWSKRFADPLEDAETFTVDDQGYLLNIGRRAETLGQIQGQYMGLLKFTPRGWSLAARTLAVLSSNRQDRMDMTSLLSQLLEKNVPIQTMAVEGKWCEIDSESDLALYERLIRQNNTWQHDWRW